MSMAERRGLVTSDGTNTAAFGPTEWALLATNSLIWGSSFLWIAIGLDVLHPAAIGFLRVILGAAAISLVPAARKPVDRGALPVIALIGILGSAGPGLLFAFAEQRIESSVAGMVQAGAGLLILLVAIIMSRKAPGRVQVVGLIVGFIGGVVLSVPNVTGADAEPLGVFLVICAISCYAISSNITPPLVQEYGGPAVMARALWMSTILLLPYGIYGLWNSGFSWAAVVAMLILGIFGTGMARTLFAILIARAGAPRAAVVSYLVPVVAVILGVTFRDESVGPVELFGLALILASAWFISRAERPRK